ncbi:hypothetical protein EMIHUDRAFT_109164 [Emiliania huxleyi CCMP1516]|uniref:Helitron helicase-like domain-containing protein n=2 Tax=Emiliania huxleyi TaxID=2903 RepID=A0A0D3KSJ9_EMIH1|nr:hypothetical protein EMIHUDRAFT_109164 [Emiliania huxleyi CCMP1516]EOD38734.1 hypothetical protein EMIHUDRAFT_109164 [Emiliania huxleyi CCMP1516]|eukprot:XP_005791163.1 hypothetical protein EMIHUDRAFT_109164 [Emiliania huxleyi CCMP1516]
MACGLLLFAVFLGCLPSVGGTATVPVSRTVVRGRHILTRKEYLDTFAGDTAGWAQYMEDQYFAEQGVSLTADAEERVSNKPGETLGQAKSRLFFNRVRKPNMHPTELSQAANQSRVQRKRESPEQRDKGKRDDRTRRQTKRARQAAARPARRASEILNGSLLVEGSDVGKLALTKEEQSTSTTCAGCGAELLPGEVTSSNPTYGSICCKKNKVSLPPICMPCPEVTKLWHDADGVVGKTLRKFARAINNTLAFASQKVKRPNNLPGSSTWSPTVVIQGRVHHFIGSLAPNDNQSKQFVQTYINDPSMSECQQIDYRMGAIYLPADTSQAEKERVRECLEIMQKAITEHNPYVQDFVKAYERTGGNETKAKIVINADARPPPPPGDGPATSHPRRYNAPSDKTYGRQDYAEVAVLKPDADENGRDIVVKMRGGALKTINETHRGYDPLHFVILHPAGDDGWKIGMTKTGSKQSISPCDFYAYREYVCSAFAKAEHCRLQWQRHNQTTIRAVLYQNLVDHVAAGDAGKKIGKRVVLSSSFVGGNRDLHRRYQDAMAVVRAHGKPSFFITFTCNPNWPEIVNSLPKGLKACDRPDIAIRAAGDVCGPSTSAVETGNSLEAGNSSDEDASHCETLGADDSSDASYTDGDSSSIDSDVGGASDEDSDASWLPSD